MEPRQIEAFRAVARHAGFARAARATGIGQPSLTRSVARLEADIGFALFVRGQGAARLTPEGESFLREVERRFVGLEQLRRVANDIRDFGTGRLRLAVLPAAASGLVPAALRSFVDRFPEVTIALHVRPSGTVYEWVSSGHCDLGLAAPRTGFAGVEETMLLDLPGVVAMPKGHRLARLRRALTPADLAGETFLAQGLEDPSRTVTDAAFRAAPEEYPMRRDDGYTPLARAGDWQHVKDEGVVAFGLRRHPSRKAPEWIVLRVLRPPLIETERRIGDNRVKPHQVVAFEQCRAVDRVTPADVGGISTVQKHVHAGERDGLAVRLLTIEPEVIRPDFFAGAQQERARATGRVTDQRAVFRRCALGDDF